MVDQESNGRYRHVRTGKDRLRAIVPLSVDGSQQRSSVLSKSKKNLKFTVVVGIITVMSLIAIWGIIWFLL